MSIISFPFLTFPRHCRRDAPVAVSTVGRRRRRGPAGLVHLLQPGGGGAVFLGETRSGLLFEGQKRGEKYRLISLRLRPFPPRCYKLPFPLRPFNSGRKFPPFSNSPQLDKLEKAAFPAFHSPRESRGGGRDLPPLCYNTPIPLPPFTTFPSSSFCLVKASSSSFPSTPLFLSNIVNEH